MPEKIRWEIVATARSMTYAAMSAGVRCSSSMLERGLCDGRRTIYSFSLPIVAWVIDHVWHLLFSYWAVWVEVARQN